MIKNLKLRFGLFIILIIVHWSAHANEKKEFYFNQWTADWLNRQAQNLDMSLSGRRYTKTTERSQATLANEFYFREGDGLTFRPNIDLDLALPNFQKKYKLMFSNYNKNQVRRSNYGRREFLDENDQDYGAIISFMQKVGDFDITFQPRIGIGDPIETFYTLRAESQARVGNSRLFTRIEFFADSEKGTGQFASLVFRRSFWDTWGTSFILEEEYQDGRNFLTTLQGATLHYRINEDINLDNSVVVRSRNKPNHFRMYEYSVGPSFTHMILKDELRYSINYFHFFHEDFNFRGRSAASFIVELIF